MKESVAVTGATGMVGSQIVSLLLKKGYDVSALHRSSSKFDLIDEDKDKVDWVEGNLEAIDTLERLVKGKDYVIHAAALIAPDSKKKEMHDTNIKGTANIVNVCLEEGIKRLVHISSVAALGRPAEDFTLEETSPWIEHSLTGAYAFSKYHGELEAFRGCAEGLEVNVINPSLILGNGDWQSGSTSIIAKTYKGAPFFPTGGTGIVDARDVAVAALQAMTMSQYGERFIISGHHFSFQQLIDAIGTRLAVKTPKRPLNNWLIRAASIVEGIRSLLTGRPQIFNTGSMRRAMYDYHYNNQKSEKELGMQYRGKDETLDYACQSYLEYINE